MTFIFFVKSHYVKKDYVKKDCVENRLNMALQYNNEICKIRKKKNWWSHLFGANLENNRSKLCNKIMYSNLFLSELLFLKEMCVLVA